MSGSRKATGSGDFIGRELGVYTIRGRLGAGGMGEVYRAHDTRLGRDVALKILPEAMAAEADRVRRFEKEARAVSALNHPNIVTVYAIGSSDGVSYIAMELVEGKTLRDLLASGPLPMKRLFELSVQITDGLARAHDAGIVHRDLKPENVMVSKDGFAKILDFGLAKRLPFENSESSGVPNTTLTEEGFIVGTVGYMSPEQASGRSIDYRSDQFAFGTILYEMITGHRAFERPSKGEALAAIIRDQPDRAPLADSAAPAPLRWIVDRCLAKDPNERYACTRDLSSELKTMGGRWSELPGAPVAERRRFPWAAVFAAAAALAGAAAIFFAARRPAPGPLPEFQRLTFRRGEVSSARFAPDGRTVVYSATWDRDPGRVFTTRTDGQDSTRLQLPDASLLSVSSQGELALSLGGTLSRASLAGGAPRELIQGVSQADWSPDGKSLAIVRTVAGKDRLEFPIGKVLYETDAGMRSPRVSPDGARVAFLLEHAVESNVSVEMVDLAGKHTVLSKGWKRGHNLAWSSDGREVWFTANERGWRTSLNAVDFAGKVRVVLRLPSWIAIDDIAPDGRVLINLVTMRSMIRALTPGDTRERDLTWHESSFAKAITPDGKTLLFDEGSEGYFHAIYVRPMDGSPAKLLGDGRSIAISPDGRWVASNARERGSALVLLPTGAGEPKTLDDGTHHFQEGAFLPDSKRLLATSGEQSWVIDIATGEMSAVGGPDSDCEVVSPDGREAACVGSASICPIDGGACRPIPGFRQGEEEVFQWSADGRSLFVGPGAPIPLRIDRLDLATGRRQPWREFNAEEAAVQYRRSDYFAMTPDAKSYAYSSFITAADLYLVSGLK